MPNPGQELNLGIRGSAEGGPIGHVDQGKAGGMVIWISRRSNPWSIWIWSPPEGASHKPPHVPPNSGSPHQGVSAQGAAATDCGQEGTAFLLPGTASVRPAYGAPQSRRWSRDGRQGDGGRPVRRSRFASSGQDYPPSPRERGEDSPASR